MYIQTFIGVVYINPLNNDIHADTERHERTVTVISDTSIGFPNGHGLFSLIKQGPHILKTRFSFHFFFKSKESIIVRGVNGYETGRAEIFSYSYSF